MVRLRDLRTLLPVLYAALLLAVAGAGEISRSDAPPPAGATAAPPKTKLRIAYVTNTWWPKVDGAGVAAMGHVRHFVAAGHAVLVVRPNFPADSPLRRAYGGGDVGADPLPAAARLEYVEYRTFGARGGGYEPEMAPGEFPAVERALVAWAPDVLLVMDPDMFLLDTFRVPGFNGLMAQAEPPVSIACFTTFMVEIAVKMPEYWWVDNPPVRALFEQGLATAYGRFDHIFLNGDDSLSYLKPIQVLSDWGWRPVGASAAVVSSRGVAADFCTAAPADACAPVPAAAALRLPAAAPDAAAATAAAAPPSPVVKFVYVGRLAYDKSVDVLLAAFASALTDGGMGGRAALYLVGTGELLPLVREYEEAHPGGVHYAGHAPHHQVACVLREADAYVSAAPNET